MEIIIIVWILIFFFRTPRKLDDKGKHVRCVIPTKDNPPPEMSSWLLQFQVSIDETLMFLINVTIIIKKSCRQNWRKYLVNLVDFFF